MIKKKKAYISFLFIYEFYLTFWPCRSYSTSASEWSAYCRCHWQGRWVYSQELDLPSMFIQNIYHFFKLSDRLIRKLKSILYAMPVIIFVLMLLLLWFWEFVQLLWFFRWVFTRGRPATWRKWQKYASSSMMETFLVHWKNCSYFRGLVPRWHIW